MQCLWKSCVTWKWGTVFDRKMMWTAFPKPVQFLCQKMQKISISVFKVELFDLTTWKSGDHWIDWHLWFMYLSMDVMWESPEHLLLIKQALLSFMCLSPEANEAALVLHCWVVCNNCSVWSNCNGVYIASTVRNLGVSCSDFSFLLKYCYGRLPVSLL